jgi:SAM-dependent methyltransferase
MAMHAPGARSLESLRLQTSDGAVPLGFARENDVVYLVARSRSAQWPVDLLRSGRAELSLPDATAIGTPVLVTSAEERQRILALFETKYGAEAFARWYEKPARVVRVVLDGGRVDAGPGSAAYYAWLESEFDNVADGYDHHITGNRINLLLRNRSLAVLRERFADAPRVLEIGCGSGMETLPLLEEGHRVTAVDISAGMLATVRRKAEAAHVSDRLTTREMPARDLMRLAEEGAQFDAAFSTYGALNCEPDLASIPAALAHVLAPGAPFVTAVYNRWCLFELAGYSLSLQPGRALGRRKNPVRVGSSRFCVDVYAHSVADFDRLFSPYFRRERLEAVPVLLPPSDLVDYANRFDRHFERLAGWDAALGRRWPWNRLGDHFLMTWVRRP